MTKMLFFSGLWPNARSQRSHHRRAIIDLALATVLCLSGWIACEWCSLRQEQQAKAILEREYHAGVIAPIYSDQEDRIFDDQCLDLRELLRGRLYVPVTSVSFHNTTVDRRAWDELACFRHLERLFFQDCQIEDAPKFSATSSGCLKGLSFVRTPINIERLRCISQLNRLEDLTFDATGLKGDWLRPLSALRELRHLIAENGDFSDGATDSLGRMKGLTWLQLPHARIDSKLGPALASLDKLECLLLDDTSFDDEGMKHLASLNQLKQLHLKGTAITDGGMASVARLPNLWRLSLSNTKVGDAGLRDLSQLRKLAGLDIVGTRATNSCLPTLAAMYSLKNVLVGKTGIRATAQGFVGVLDDDVWYPNEARHKEAEEYSHGEKDSGDQKDSPK